MAQDDLRPAPQTMAAAPSDDTNATAPMDRELQNFLSRLATQIADSDRRHGAALKDMQQRLAGMSERAGDMDGPAAPELTASLEKLEQQISTLAHRLEETREELNDRTAVATPADVPASAPAPAPLQDDELFAAHDEQSEASHAIDEAHGAADFEPISDVVRFDADAEAEVEAEMTQLSFDDETDASDTSFADAFDSGAEEFTADSADVEAPADETFETETSSSEFSSELDNFADDGFAAGEFAEADMADADTTDQFDTADLSAIQAELQSDMHAIAATAQQAIDAPASDDFNDAFDTDVEAAALVEGEAEDAFASEADPAPAADWSVDDVPAEPVTDVADNALVGETEEVVGDFAEELDPVAADLTETVTDAQDVVAAEATESSEEASSVTPSDEEIGETTDSEIDGAASLFGQPGDWSPNGHWDDATAETFARVVETAALEAPETETNGAHAGNAVGDAATPVSPYRRRLNAAIDRDWMETALAEFSAQWMNQADARDAQFIDRFDTLTAEIERSVQAALPHESFETLVTRLDAIEQQMGDLAEATPRDDVVVAIETHIADMSQQMDRISAEASRIDGLEAQVTQLLTMLTTTRDELPTLARLAAQDVAATVTPTALANDVNDERIAAIYEMMLAIVGDDGSTEQHAQTAAFADVPSADETAEAYADDMDPNGTSEAAHDDSEQTYAEQQAEEDAYAYAEAEAAAEAEALAEAEAQAAELARAEAEVEAVAQYERELHAAALDAQHQGQADDTTAAYAPPTPDARAMPQSVADRIAMATRHHRDTAMAQPAAARQTPAYASADAPASTGRHSVLSPQQQETATVGAGIRATAPAAVATEEPEKPSLIASALAMAEGARSKLNVSFKRKKTEAAAGMSSDAPLDEDATNPAEHAVSSAENLESERDLAMQQAAAAAVSSAPLAGSKSPRPVLIVIIAALVLAGCGLIYSKLTKAPEAPQTAIDAPVDDLALPADLLDESADGTSGLTGTPTGDLSPMGADDAATGNLAPNATEENDAAFSLEAMQRKFAAAEAEADAQAQAQARALESALPGASSSNPIGQLGDAVNDATTQTVEPLSNIATPPIDALTRSDAAGTDALSTASLPPEHTGSLAVRMEAAAGDPEAQFVVAAALASGTGANRDDAGAALWYQRAATSGYAPAQYRLGTHYERGRGVTQDQGRAKVWYERAARAGNVKAMHNLAVLMAGAEDGGPKYDSAATWFERAADFGLRDSQFNLAILYKNGLGVANSPIQAFKWFDIAARNGDAEAARRRDALKTEMTAQAISAAERLSANHTGSLPSPEANRVAQTAAAQPVPSVATRPALTSNTQARSQASKVRRAQQLLAKLGYNTGTPDGRMGPNTQAALRRFEARIGLVPQGKLTDPLLNELERRAGGIGA